MFPTPHATALRRSLRRIAFALGAAILVGCTSSASDSTGPNGQVAATVTATANLKFSPATVTIKAGQAVRWTNAATFTHTVTDDASVASNPSDAVLPAGAAAFDSGPISGGAEYTHTFTVPGEYHYFCKPHEHLGMLGTVIVTP